MSEDEKLNAVLGELYDAVLNPGLWGFALQRVARFVGGRDEELHFDDLTQRFLLAGHDVGSQLQYMLMHSDLYGDFDPFTEVSSLEVDEVLSLLELAPHRDQRAHCSYRKRKRSGRGAAVGAMGASAADPRQFGTNRNASEDVIDGEMMRRMSLVAPHIRRAILIGKVFGRKLSEAATFSCIFEKLRAGLFLIDRDGHILHTNAAGRRLLNADELLQTINGRLVACDAGVNRAIHEAIARRSSLDFDREGIVLPLTTENLERHVLHVLPQGPGGDLGFGTPGAVAAAVIVCETRLEGLIDEGVIRRAFRLTPAELRVLIALFDVGGISEVSAFLGISRSTVKTHVSRLFAKTSTTRQAELVKLVAGYRPMFST